MIHVLLSSKQNIVFLLLYSLLFFGGTSDILNLSSNQKILKKLFNLKNLKSKILEFLEKNKEKIVFF